MDLENTIQMCCFTKKNAQKKRHSLEIAGELTKNKSQVAFAAIIKRV